MRYFSLNLFLRPKFSLKIQDGKVVKSRGKLPPSFAADIAQFSGCSSGLVLVKVNEGGTQLKVYGQLAKAR
jgi:hypothetical protein